MAQLKSSASASKTTLSLNFRPHLGQTLQWKTSHTGQFRQRSLWHAAMAQFAFGPARLHLPSRWGSERRWVSLVRLKVHFVGLSAWLERPYCSALKGCSTEADSSQSLNAPFAILYHYDWCAQWFQYWSWSSFAGFDHLFASVDRTGMTSLHADCFRSWSRASASSFTVHRCRPRNCPSWSTWSWSFVLVSNSSHLGPDAWKFAFCDSGRLTRPGKCTGLSEWASICRLADYSDSTCFESYQEPLRPLSSLLALQGSS